jgi:hypothetical protein
VAPDLGRRPSKPSLACSLDLLRSILTATQENTVFVV